MLILVAATVNYSIKNGLLSKAKETKKGEETEQEKEQIGLVLNEWSVEKNLETNQNFLDFMKEKLKEKANVKMHDEKENSISVEFKNSKITYEVREDRILEKISNDYLALREGDIVYYKDENGNDIECIVLYDSTEKYGVQIIPRNPVSKVELGNGIETGNYSYSTNSAHFETAKTSYNNAIDILNTAAQVYVESNPNLASIAKSSRCVGSLPSCPNTRNKTKYSNSYEYFSSYNYQLENPESDTIYKESNIENYIVDWEQLQKLGIKNITDTTNGNCYWLASRHGETATAATKFGVRYVNKNGALCFDYLWYKEPGSRRISKGFLFGIRPCITLKSNIIVNENNNKKFLSLN